MGSPLHRNAFRLNEMAVVAALQPPFRADLKLTLELRSRVRCLHGRRPLTTSHTRPIVRRGEGLPRRDRRPRRALLVATGIHIGRL